MTNPPRELRDRLVPFLAVLITALAGSALYMANHQKLAVSRQAATQATVPPKASRASRPRSPGGARPTRTAPLPAGQAHTPSFLLRAVDGDTGLGIPGLVFARGGNRPRWSAILTEMTTRPNEGKVTAADGRVRFQDERTPGGIDLSFPTFDWYQEPGENWTREGSPPPEGTLEGDVAGEMVLLFRHGRKAAGRVVRGEGPDAPPVPHATVDIGFFATDGAPLPGLGTMERSTDADGRFFYLVPPSATLATALAWSDGGAGEGRVEIDHGAQVSNLVVEVEPLADLAGHVQTSDGRPVPGAQVRAIHRWYMGERSFLAQADREGGYSIEGLPAAAAYVSAAPPRGSGLTTPNGRQLQLHSGKNNGIDFVCDPAEAIEGVVTDTSDKLLKGVWVQAVFHTGKDDSIERRLVATTDKDGSYRLEGLPSGTLVESLAASMDGYTQATHTKVKATDGPQNFQLRQLANIEFSVVDPVTGKRVPNCQWSLLYNRSGGGFTPVSSGVYPGLAEFMSIYSVGRGDYRLDVTTRATPPRTASRYFSVDDDTRPTRVVAELAPGHPVTGLVTSGRSHTPLAGARVTATGLLGDPATGKALDSGSATTGPDGRYRLVGVPEGTVTLVARTGDRRSVTRVLAVTPASNPATLDIHIPGGVLRGHGTGADGQPLKGNTLRFEYRGELSGGQNDTWTTTFDREGNFHQGNLPAGDIEVTVLGDMPGASGILERRTIRLEDEQDLEVTFDLSASVTLSGVFTLHGTPVNSQGFFGLRPRAGGPDVLIRPAEGGRYSVFVTPGKYSLLSFPSAITAVNQVVVADYDVAATPHQQARDFDLDFHDAEARIEGGDDADLPGKTLSIARTDEPSPADVRGSFAGNYVKLEGTSTKVPGLVPGTYRASVNLGGERQPRLGSSPPTKIGPGMENVFHVTLEELVPRTVELTVTVPPGHHEYKFLQMVPELWFEDPLNPSLRTGGSGQYGNSAFDVPGGAKDLQGIRLPWPRVNDRTGEVTFRVTKTLSPGAEIHVLGGFNNWNVSPENVMREEAGK